MAAPMSDVTGYRSDGGGLGQDQGIGRELRGILTAKLPLLSAPGTVLENSLYYDINSSSVTAVEEQATFAKDRITLNNFQMGSSPSAYIPSVLFAGTVFWFAELPEFNWPSAAVQRNNAWNIHFPEGWGFSALNNIIVYMGASSIAQIQISAETNFLICCATCETYSKRAKMIYGAGRCLSTLDRQSQLAYPPTTAPSNGPYMWRLRGYTADSYNIPDVQGNPACPSMKLAVVPIRLPWSSMAVLDKRLSLDTKLSTQPIQITLQTAPLSQFSWMGSQLAPLFPQQWYSSTLQLWQEELSDKSLSVRNALLAMPEFNVGYPFQYAQSIPFTVDDNNDNGSSAYQFTMNITSIINSDLTTFMFFIQWYGRTNPANGQPQPLFGERLWDIELLLNGQRFFFFDRESYDSVTLAKQLDTTTYPSPLTSYNVVQAASADASNKYIPFPSNGFMYEFNNSRLRSIVSEAHMQNTARFTNQTFQLRFKINRDIYYLLTTTATATSQTYTSGVSKAQGYTLFMTYLYNAVFLVGGDGGTTKLITN